MGWVGNFDRGAAEVDVAAVRCHDTGKDLGECAFTRSVFAEQGVDLALLQCEIYAAQGCGRAEVLLDSLGFENGRHRLSAWNLSA